MRGTPGLALERPRKTTIMGDGMLANFLVGPGSQVNPNRRASMATQPLCCGATPVPIPRERDASQSLGSAIPGSNPQGWDGEAVLPHAANAAPAPVHWDGGLTNLGRVFPRTAPIKGASVPSMDRWVSIGLAVPAADSCLLFRPS